MKIGILLLYSRVWFVKNANSHGFHDFFNNLLGAACRLGPAGP